jgi:hypothetical protein
VDYIVSMNECDNFYDETILDKILNNIVTSKTQCDKGSVSNFPERYHPRRKMMYKPWDCDSNTFFILRSRGVPVLTAYFLCEISNNVRTHRSISYFVSSRKKDDAVNTLKIL